MDAVVTELRHIGVYTNSIKKLIVIIKHLFDVEEKDIQVVEKAECLFAFIQLAGIKIELIQPLSEHRKEMLGKPNEGIHHIAFTVKDINESVKRLKKRGVQLGLFTKEAIRDTGSSKIAYLDPKTTGGIIIELVEPIDP